MKNEIRNLEKTINEHEKLLRDHGLTVEHERELEKALEAAEELLEKYKEAVKQGEAQQQQPSP